MLALLQSALLVGSPQTDHHSRASHLIQILLLYACLKVIAQATCIGLSHVEEADLSGKGRFPAGKLHF